MPSKSNFKRGVTVGVANIMYVFIHIKGIFNSLSQAHLSLLLLRDLDLLFSLSFPLLLTGDLSRDLLLLESRGDPGDLDRLLLDLLGEQLLDRDFRDGDLGITMS